MDDKMKKGKLSKKKARLIILVFSLSIIIVSILLAFPPFNLIIGTILVIAASVLGIKLFLDKEREFILVFHFIMLFIYFMMCIK